MSTAAKFQCRYYGNMVTLPIELKCDGVPHCPPENEDEKAKNRQAWQWAGAGTNLKKNGEV